MTQFADTIFRHADVVTVADAVPSAEAVAVKDGHILAVGTDAEVMAHAGPETRVVDLGGRTLVPGFVDGHSHFMNALQIVTWANVSTPPVGPVSCIPDLIGALKAHFERWKPAPGEWVLGYGYDGNNLAEGRELTRDDLDPHFPDNPILLIHVSNHGAVLNSRALDLMGIDAGTPTPPGGIILRKPGTNEPAGLLMEMAFLPIFAKLPKPGLEELLERVGAAQEIYAAAGVTTMQEGATASADLPVLVRAAQEGRLYLDLASYALITELDEILAEHPPSTFGTYRNRLKLNGAKAFADGSPMSRTAFFREPYLTGGPSGEENWRGEPTFPPETLNAMVKKVYDHGLRLNVHVNGDAAIDMVLAAHEHAAGPSRRPPVGMTIIHSQFVRRDQLEKYREYGFSISFYTEHTFFFCDAHMRNLGPERTNFCSPMRTALDMGLHCANHTDFSVLPIDQLFTIFTAVNRVGRDGKVIGPDQRVTPLEALRAITIESAYEYGEADRKGSIEVGKLADLVVLSGNPLKVDPLAIRDIRVMATYKEGKEVYAAEAAAVA